jgi:uncharacterized Fe-S radical SAM superfamily protein PflX
MMLELQQIGCHNLNWVTPEHVVPQILEALPAAVDAGLRLPAVEFPEVDRHVYRSEFERTRDG